MPARAAVKKVATRAPVKAPKGNEKPVRALFGSRNAYRRALADWYKVWSKWRAEFKRLKKRARQERRLAVA